MKKNKTKKIKKPKRLILLDAHAILHRAYHALPEFTSPSGEPTGALYGVSAMLTKIIADLKPDYIVACYDLPQPTFRHEVYEDYKAGRAKTDDSLISQIKRSRDIFEVFSVPMYDKVGFEADDILGTIVEQMKKPLDEGELEIIIASGDMDTLQLVDKKKVQVYTLKKGINDTILYDEKAVKDRFHFMPKLLTDYKGLRGDPSDNIIGIKGIGDKTATLLITNFGTLEKMYKKLKKGEEAFLKAGVTPRIINLLREGEEEAIFSKTLASIRRDVPITFTLPKDEWEEGFELEKLKKLFSELGFRTLIGRVEKLLSSKVEEEAKKEEIKEKIDEDEVLKIGVALWLVDSNITKPNLEDILNFGGTDSFAEASSKILETLKKRKMEKLYNNIEKPLIPLLREAHERGILVDKKILKKLSTKYHKELDVIIKNIYKEAGEEFNIKSPKQLSEVLFTRLELPTKGIKKTPGGVISTRESELEKLREAHPIIKHILSFREIQKILSTYIDNIPPMLDKEGALHTTFIQTGTTTGRMSSVDPNLQNIPVKGEYGKEIRAAFLARKGFKLAAFDYSQIELRVLAFLSKDKALISIFNEGRDVHNAVASEAFGVSPEKVTKDMRRKAKVINFGIIYGMGITSLQKALESTRSEAQRFYDAYFEQFPDVKKYIEKVKRDAHINGYTETLFGRRRYVAGLSSHIPFIRAAAERMAFNAPIQGTATGDIIKLALIQVDLMLKKEGFDEKVFLLLQVHDELIYEVEEGVVKKVTPLIKKTMENVVKVAVPLIVDSSVASNWGNL